MRLINKLDRYLEDKNYQIIIKKDQISILNFEEVIDFSTNIIIIRCDKKIINIEGKKMIISKMLDEEILINGEILNVRIN